MDDGWTGGTYETQPEREAACGTPGLAAQAGQARGPSATGSRPASRTLAVQLAGIRGEPSRSCPRCGGRAAVHARLTRAVHDWETTFVPCLRLRCCGTTFTATPPGLKPRAQYSDRVVAVARTLVACGVSLRRCVRLLGSSGVRVTATAARDWTVGVGRTTAAQARLATQAEGDLALRLRPDLWLVLDTPAPREALASLRGDVTLPRASTTRRQAQDVALLVADRPAPPEPARHSAGGAQWPS